MTMRKTTFPFPWLKSRMMPFRSDKNGDIYFLEETAIKDLEWETFDHAHITLSGRLPQALHLLEIEVGDGLEILYKDCGPLEEYQEDEVAFRLAGIERRIWRLSNLVITDPQDASEVELELHLTGKLSCVNALASEAR